jgi:hypothetical protein
MSYFKERIPALIAKYKKNIDYLESIIEANGEDLLGDDDDDDDDKDRPKSLGLGNEKAVNIIKAKKEARLELIANYEEVDRIEAIHMGKDLIKDTSNQHPTKAYANKD